MGVSPDSALITVLTSLHITAKKWIIMKCVLRKFDGKSVVFRYRIGQNFMILEETLPIIYYPVPEIPDFLPFNAFLEIFIFSCVCRLCLDLRRRAAEAPSW